ncbi:MAG: SDR family NAD(P)-dependent oxidoreductase [Boseongicola sp. SB0677_bin_26]|nr:SDR family NAD(P)-dependent oxidoreductase [Boseongicola sp. SB0665_bin_10]MYG28058.1 SDR family NAD(P)-dependent oxidoreductase [Boseongicola sp. SB0677_bin_26]
MTSRKTEGDVAIVGYGHRMPGGIRSDSDFWHLLVEREIVREPIRDRYGRGHPPIGEFSGPGRLASPWEGLVRDSDELLFDRALFGMSHNEMMKTEPQVRMLLNCAWETVEHAGWDFHALRNSSTGVFVGAQVPAVSSWRHLHGINEYSVTGISVAMLANRISYHFNLMGSSISYCTACSAGLSALHSAMNALQCGDCDQALVGAVTYLASARLSSSFNLMGVISPDGKCHSFDARANGYMRSEGAFIFALKPLAAAERDGDPIHAVIEASAVNAAGSADDAVGLAPGRNIIAPTRHAQVELMRTAAARAGRTAQEFDYVEAHATGTVVGDRIEGNAISEAFGGFGREVPLRVSSVKSNVGHMEAAAFHCALLKVVLMMQRRTFAPTSKNHVVPNPEIDFEGCPMKVQTEVEPFPDHPVVVGINSFGFGGANGHCVVREYRPARPRIWSAALAPEAGYVVPLSARNAKSLAQTAGQLRETLGQRPMDLYTLAGNLSRRRTHFATRAALAVRDLQELKDGLDAVAEERVPIETAEEGEPRLAMVFSGQGTQWSGCGRALYDADPVFRRVIDVIEAHWREHSDVSLREACFSAPQSALDECELAQPAIFMLQCALVELFKTWGVYPDCVVGHSSGEVAAAYACGALSLEDATRLVFHRATLQQRTAGSGRMLAIGLDRGGVEELLEDLDIPFRLDAGQSAQIEIACENAPANTVICGIEIALQPVVEELNLRNLQHRLVPGNIAFHSRAMDAIREDVAEALSFLDERTFDSDVPFISSVTGNHTERFDSAYWWSNIRQPVRFAAAMDAIKRDHRPHAVLELAPHCALQPVIAQCLADGVSVPTSVATFMRDTDTRISFLESLGALFRAGVTLDFASRYPRPEPVPHLLPGHPRDEEKKADMLADDEFHNRGAEYAHGPLVGHRIPCDHLLFEARFSDRAFPWAADHVVHHAAIMPATGYIELVLEALGGVPVHFDVIEFLQPCPVPRTPVRLQTALHPVANSPDEFTFVISTRPYGEDARSESHCRGKVRVLSEPPAPDTPGTLGDVDRSGFAPVEHPSGDELYERFEAVLGDTYSYGPHCRNIRQIQRHEATQAYLVDLEVDQRLWAEGREEGYVFYPPLIDGAFQAFLYSLLLTSDHLCIPRRIEHMTFLGAASGARLTCLLRDPPDRALDIDDKGQFNPPEGERLSGSISFYDGSTGALVAHVQKYIHFDSNLKRGDLPHSRHRIVWQPKFLTDEPACTVGSPDDDIDPVALIAALEEPVDGTGRAIRVLELAGCRTPEQTMLGQCVGHLSNAGRHSEYWLVSHDEEAARKNYEAFRAADAALRFDCIDPTGGRAAGLDEGLLRPGAAELLLLHRDAAASDPADWEFWRRLVVAGGLALVSHPGDEVLEPGAGWTVVRAATRSTLLQSSQSWSEHLALAAVPAPRWVVGEPRSLARDWLSLLDDPEVHEIALQSIVSGDVGGIDEWPRVAELQAVDFFCGLDPDDPTGEGAVSAFVALVRALALHRTGHARSRCRVTVVTRKAAFDVQDPRGSGLWGAVRGMAVEVGEDAAFDFRLVDLGDDSDLDALASLARCDLREREIAVRQGRLWVPRTQSVRDHAPCVPAGDAATYRLCLDNPGQIGGLQMKTYDPAPLGPGMVEIDVKAAALNFRDVMVTLGLLPSAAYERSALGLEVGMEASGVVRQVGDGAGNFQVGDEVIFTQGGCIANRAVVNGHLVFSKPASLDLEQAASLLSVYLTAYYALVHLARLSEGQAVLIHSAMGGVGQAAIALARRAGATIYATAGSDAKRDRLLELGASAAFDSHSEDWYDQLMEATRGEGVDVVLNSLAGRQLAQCLEALRPGGWHCEIGKVDIYSDSPLGLYVFRKNLRFAAIDVDRLMVDDPWLLRRLSQTCLDLLGQGELPPLPITVYDYEDYAKALRLMTGGKHQGKLVLRAPPACVHPPFPIVDRRPLLDPDATYLVTGGLGGFGLCLLPYLVSIGARHLTLMDRDPERRRDADWLRSSTALQHMDQECEIEIVAGDVAVEADVERCVANLRRPLKGVFHLAGVLDDRLLGTMSRESVETVFAPKAAGALNLHRATAGHPLDHFVMASSTASTFGNPGQINYGAASAYIDGLAACRRRQGLPALSCNVSAVAEVGMASRNHHVLRMLRMAGMPPVSIHFAITNLDYALRRLSDSDHLVTAVFKRVPLTVDSADYMRIGRLMSNHDAFQGHSDDRLTLEAVMTQIAEKVAELCGHEEGDVDEPLASFGFNSISVAELVAFIQNRFNFQVSALELMTTATCRSLARSIVYRAEESEETEGETGAASGTDAPLSGRRLGRRRPSEFAGVLEDHFPSAPGAGQDATTAES